MATNALIPEYLLCGVTIYADGGCLNNGTPNAHGYGSMKVTNNGNPVPSNFAGKKEVQHRFEHGHGAENTNNTAELMTLSNALTYCAELIKRGHAQGIALCMDSKLALGGAVKGVAGMKKPAKNLIPLYDKVHEQYNTLDGQVVLIWVPNEAIKMVLGH